jgi:hypothetical protein
MKQSRLAAIANDTDCHALSYNSFLWAFHHRINNRAAFDGLKVHHHLLDRL